MNLILRLYRSFVIGNIKEMDDEPDVDAWLRFLEKLPEPKDYLDVSFNKYRCRSFPFPLYKRFLLNLVSFPLAVKALCSLLRVKKPLPKPEASRLLIERKAGVDFTDIIPDELINSFEEVHVTLDSRAERERLSTKLSSEAAELLKAAVRRHPFHFYYIFWVARELSKNCAYIETHNPSAVAVYIEERNVAGPILRCLYETSGRKYVSFMHGEYLLRLVQGYMSFSEYYIWHEEYEHLFRDVLHCDIPVYTLYKPKKLTKKWHFEKDVPDYFCTYYFSAESRESICRLREVFEWLESRGKRCKVRPHPRYSQWDFIRKQFRDDQIEDTRQVSLEDSLRRTRYVIGLATTVLAEGYYEGKEIVVDDVSSPEKFANLEKRCFIVLKRPHMLLSELLRQIEEEK